MAKNKLRTIGEALERNPEVIVVRKEFPIHFYSSSDSYFCFPNNYYFKFLVAPKGGLYTAEELNEFMENLVPELEPTRVERFDYNEGGNYATSGKLMEYGNICFREEIGKQISIEKSVAIITDEEVLSNLLDGEKEHYVDGRRILYDNETTDTFKRYTTISPYPAERFIEECAWRKWASIKELKREKSQGSESAISDLLGFFTGRK